MCYPLLGWEKKLIPSAVVPVWASGSHGKKMAFDETVALWESSQNFPKAEFRTLLGRELDVPRKGLNRTLMTYRGVGRQGGGAEQSGGLLPVGLQHGLQPLYQLHPLFLQLLVPTLQFPHSCLLPGQSERKDARGNIRPWRKQRLGEQEGPQGKVEIVRGTGPVQKRPRLQGKGPRPDVETPGSGT